MSKKALCECGLKVNSCRDCIEVAEADALRRFENEGGSIKRLATGRAYGVRSNPLSGVGRKG